MALMLFDGLLDDTRLLAGEPRTAGPDPDTRRWQARPLWWSSRTDGPVGRLVVPDHQLGRVAGLVPSGVTQPVSVLNTSGAGGLTALARRSWPQITIGAAESALRDLDDLAGSAARVLAAAQDLDPEAELFVELPYTAGWQRAVEVVEAAGRLAKLDLGAVETAVAAEQLSVLVEADLGFKISGLPDRQLLPVLVTIAALIDGADLIDAAELLGSTASQSISLIVGWDGPVHTRIRRRLRRWDTAGPAALLARLATDGVPEALLSRD